MAADAPLAPIPSDCQLQSRTDYLALEDPRPLPDDLETFLANGPAPVYWGFGSMADPRPTQTLRVLKALAQSRRLIVSSRRARALCPEGTPNLHWVDNVAHQQLFRRVAAVVHHGGAGTTHSAARAGVPQIVVPHLVDQYYWAHRVHELGTGSEPMHLRRLSVASVSAALERMNPGSDIQLRAVAFAGELETSARRALGEMLHYLEGITGQA